MARRQKAMASDSISRPLTLQTLHERVLLYSTVGSRDESGPEGYTHTTVMKETQVILVK